MVLFASMWTYGSNDQGNTQKFLLRLGGITVYLGETGGVVVFSHIVPFPGIVIA